MAILVSGPRWSDPWPGDQTAGAEFQHRIYRIGVPAWSWSDTQVALTGAALLGPQDVMFALSHSGRTREVAELAAEAASRGATTIAVTNDPGSPLVLRVDLVLATAVRADGLGHHTILSRHAQMAVLDLLYVALVQRTYDRSTEAMAATTEAVRPYKQRPDGAAPGRAGPSRGARERGVHVCDAVPEDPTA